MLISFRGATFGLPEMAIVMVEILPFFLLTSIAVFCVSVNKHHNVIVLFLLFVWGMISVPLSFFQIYDGWFSPRLVSPMKEEVIKGFGIFLVVLLHRP